MGRGGSIWGAVDRYGARWLAVGRGGSLWGAVARCGVGRGGSLSDTGARCRWLGSLWGRGSLKFYLVSMPGEVKDPTQGVNV